MKRTDKKSYYLFSPWLRMFHWTMVVCIFLLIWTGVYIGNPWFTNMFGLDEVFGVMSMRTIRRIHIFAGFVLTAVLVFRVYGALRNPGDRLLPKFRQKLFWTGIWDTILHYLFIPHKGEKVYIRNSLARISYLGIYTLIVIEVYTGLAMYLAVEPNSFLAPFFMPVHYVFSEYGTHVIHHVVAWGIAVFAFLHVYMAFRSDITEDNGEVSSMVSGYKYYAEDPADVHDLMTSEEKALAKMEEEKKKAEEELAKKLANEATKGAD